MAPVRKSIINDPATFTIFEFQTQHLWVRTISGLSLISSNDRPDAAVTDVIKLAPVNTVQYSHPDPFEPPYYYTIEGGDFK